MRRSLLLLAASTTLAMAGCGSADEPEDTAAVTADEEDSTDPLVPVEVSTDLVDPEGSVVGTAWFRDDDGRAMVEVQVAGLTAGFHPMYLYEEGTCDPGTAADQPAVLDLPALLVLEDGVGSMSTLAGPMSLDELLADDGTAIVITPAVDTLADIPGGQPSPLESGSHVACGAVDG